MSLVRGPRLETLALLAPLRVRCFRKIQPHPEEATKWPSRRMGSIIGWQNEYRGEQQNDPNRYQRNTQGGLGSRDRPARGNAESAPVLGHARLRGGGSWLSRHHRQRADRILTGPGGLEPGA